MKKVKVALVGLGRLGKQYAVNLARKIKNAELVAVCSLKSHELRWAESEFTYVKLYRDYDEMLRHPGLDAVFILSSTAAHPEHLVKALQAGLHAFCEKPLAICVPDCLEVERTVIQFSQQLAVVGFVRRYDPSYRYAKEKVEGGAIGKPFLVRSQTVDKDSISSFQLEYVGNSGGIFHDFSVHDVDLIRWFLDSDVARVYAIGGAYKYPAFAEINDADNVMATCEMKNGTMAVINASRTATHGHDTYTEVVGTKGTLRIGRPAGINRVEIYDEYGARKECVENFWDRFYEGFLLMTEDFIDCIVSGRPPELQIRDAIEATRTTEAMMQSFREKKVVSIKREKSSSIDQLPGLPS